MQIDFLPEVLYNLNGLELLLISRSFWFKNVALMTKSKNLKLHGVIINVPIKRHELNQSLMGINYSSEESENASQAEILLSHIYNYESDVKNIQIPLDSYRQPST